jgi:galactose mutarotase-like enzyme
MWNGNAEFWPRHSPVLFPIVGGLLDDSFIYKNQEYTLAKHGFARDMDFKVVNATQTEASLTLESSEETLQSYPFNFVLKLTYKLDGSRVLISYSVENTSKDTMYFSIGSHPAFNVPLVENTTYEDYYLEFNEKETSVRHNLNGNILDGTVPYLDNQNTLPLKASLFYNDAVIFDDLKSTRISIKSNKTPHGLHYNFDGFPYMGIWASKDAPFVCIEPWCGLPDLANHTKKIEDKKGIISLDSSATWEKTWSLDSF